MKRILHVFFTVLFILPAALSAQLSAPDAEAVYGGRINWIHGYAMDSLTTRVFISTESANSVFYAQVDHSVWPPDFSNFQSLPDLDSDNGYGSQIRDFCADGNSGYIFTVFQGRILSASTSASSFRLLDAENVFSLWVHEGRLFFLTFDPTTKSLQFHFGLIEAATGSFTEDTDSPVYVTSLPGPNIGVTFIRVDEQSGRIYVFMDGMPPTLFKSSLPYDSLDASTAFGKLDVSGLGTAYHFDTFGIGPDGRLFVGTAGGVEPNHGKFIGYSDNDGAVWDTLFTGVSGTKGANISFAPTDSSYFVYFGTGMSNNRGEAGTWQTIAFSGFETHPNDGAVFVDPNNPAVIFLTTDQGIGASIDYGQTIFEIDAGVEAVQVNDFAMNEAKTDAWLASKSGIRRVTDYAGPSETWYNFFPMGDGSPYYSVGMVGAHPDTAYAGNVRLYKTTDGGANWDRVFSTEDPVYGFSFWSYVSAVEVNPLNDSIVVMGVNSPESGVKGGIFFSANGGEYWEAVDTDVYNTEVQDILINPVTSDSMVVYVACEYVNDGTTSSYGVKTLYASPYSGIIYDNDMIGSSGGTITNFGAYGLAANSAGDIFACGANSGNEPRVYIKEADSSYWQMLTTNGLPPNGLARAVTVGFDSAGNEVPYIAVESDLYYLESSGSKWILAFSYPVGTQINMIYWDDMLVGTGTGLYGQKLDATAIGDHSENAPLRFELMQNYPNPFNPVTTISYRLSAASDVELTVYNVLGQKVMTLVNEKKQAGAYTVTFDGAQLTSGIYFYRLKTAGGFTAVKRMLLVK